MAQEHGTRTRRSSPRGMAHAYLPGWRRSSCCTQRGGGARRARRDAFEKGLAVVAKIKRHSEVHGLARDCLGLLDQERVGAGYALHLNVGERTLHDVIVQCVVCLGNVEAEAVAHRGLGRLPETLRPARRPWLETRVPDGCHPTTDARVPRDGIRNHNLERVFEDSTGLGTTATTAAAVCVGILRLDN